MTQIAMESVLDVLKFIKENESKKNNLRDKSSPKINELKNKISELQTELAKIEAQLDSDLRKIDNDIEEKETLLKQYYEENSHSLKGTKTMELPGGCTIQFVKQQPEFVWSDSTKQAKQEILEFLEKVGPSFLKVKTEHSYDKVKIKNAAKMVLNEDGTGFIILNGEKMPNVSVVVRQDKFVLDLG